jgi:hypothetical protein
LLLLSSDILHGSVAQAITKHEINDSLIAHQQKYQWSEVVWLNGSKEQKEREREGTVPLGEITGWSHKVAYIKKPLAEEQGWTLH